MRMDLVLDALEQALWSRTGREGLIHNSDCGSQYLSIRYTQRLAEAGVEFSLGSRGDSDDNPFAETINGLYKTEVIRRRGPWRHIDNVEYATLEWVDWFNHRRLLEPIGNIPPAELQTGVLSPTGRVSHGGLTQTTESPEQSARFISQQHIKRIRRFSPNPQTKDSVIIQNGMIESCFIRPTRLMRDRIAFHQCRLETAA
jgi:hypothetical protein